jgi:hypothetical protein
MCPVIPTALAVLTPTAIGVGVVALIVLYLAFKVGKFILKVLLAIAAVAAVIWFCRGMF